MCILYYNIVVGYKGKDLTNTKTIGRGKSSVLSLKTERKEIFSASTRVAKALQWTKKLKCRKH